MIKTQGNVQENGKVRFTTAMKDYFRGYVDFTGRTTRAGFWWVMLMYSVIVAALLLLLIGSMLSVVFDIANTISDSSAYLLMSEEQLGQYMLQQVLQAGGGIIATAIIVGILILALRIGIWALSARRLRDLGFNTTGIIVWIVYSIVCTVATMYFVDNIFIIGLIFVLSIIELVFYALPTDYFVVTPDSFWAHFCRTKRAKKVALTKEEIEERHQMITSQHRELSDVDRAGLSIQEKHIQK